MINQGKNPRWLFFSSSSTFFVASHACLVFHKRFKTSSSWPDWSYLTNCRGSPVLAFYSSRFVFPPSYFSGSQRCSSPSKSLLQMNSTNPFWSPFLPSTFLKPHCIESRTPSFPVSVSSFEVFSRVHLASIYLPPWSGGSPAIGKTLAMTSDRPYWSRARYCILFLVSKVWSTKAACRRSLHLVPPGNFWSWARRLSASEPYRGRLYNQVQ